MRNYINLAFLLMASGLSAQIAIGKNSVTNSSVSLEFGSDNRGIILPFVTNLAALGTSIVPGTIAFDASTGIMSYYKGSGNWFELTKNIPEGVTYQGITIPDTTGKVDTTIQKNLSDAESARTVIGSNTADTAPGILVLSDTNKAMILPKMDSPHLNIINPAPGMMAYDTKTNQLAVFNGTVWTFWRP